MTNESTRDAYVERLKAQLDDWNAQIDKLEARARQADAETRVEYEKQIEALRSRRDDMQNRLEDLRDAAGDAWRDLQKGADDAWEEIKAAFDTALTRFR
jgi:DNA anti-recombination protein RmuC